jgi:hypothetical protein
MLYNVSKKLRKIRIFNVILYLREIEFEEIFLTRNSLNSI